MLSECSFEGYGDFATEDSRASAKRKKICSVERRHLLEQKVLDLRQVASIPERISW